MLINPTDPELLFIANLKLASYLTVKLNFKSECGGMVGGRLFGFAFNRLPKGWMHGVVQAGFWSTLYMKGVQSMIGNGIMQGKLTE